MSLSMIKSDRGKDMILHENFTFYRHKVLKKSGEQSWRCSKKRLNCKAKLYTLDTDNLIISRKEDVHNHEADERKVYRKVVSNACKTKAVEDVTERPGEIIWDALASSNLLQPCLTSTDVRYIRRNIYNCRRRTLGAVPQNIEKVHSEPPLTSKVENEVAENSKDYIIENASNETICSEEDVKPEILQDISSQTPTKLTTNTLPEIEITLKDVLKFLRRKFPDQYTELIKDQLDSLKASPNTSTSSRSQDHSEASSSQDVTDTYEEHYLSHPKRRMIDKSQRNLSTNVSGSSSTMVDPLKTSENGEINYEVPKIHPDLAFFMSLVPSVQMLDEDQRLLFRMKVLKALRSVKQGNTQIVESSGIETHRIYDISELKEESLSESDISFDE